MSLIIKSLNVPSAFISWASGLTNPSASSLIHPKKEYSKTQGHSSIQLVSRTVNANTSFLSLEIEAISETTTGNSGYLLCLEYQLCSQRMPEKHLHLLNVLYSCIVIRTIVMQTKKIRWFPHVSHSGHKILQPCFSARIARTPWSHDLLSLFLP
jgi:hypothetical protein